MSKGRAKSSSTVESRVESSIDRLAYKIHTAVYTACAESYISYVDRVHHDTLDVVRVTICKLVIIVLSKLAVLPVLRSE